MTEEFYGEVPEHFVAPEPLARGKAAFDFCLRHYGDASQPLKLRWIRKSESDYHFAKLGDLIQELGGEKVSRLERGYETEPEPVLGFVRARIITKERSGSVFVATETPIERIIRVVGHEFYHARYSPLGYSNDADENAANRFGERVEREMAEAAAREADEKWRERFRQVQRKR